MFAGPLFRITLANTQVLGSVAGSPLNLNTSTKGYDQYGNLNSTWSQKWATNSSSCAISQAGVLTLGNKAETFWVWCNNSQQTVSNHTVVSIRPGALSRISMAYTESP